MTFEGMDPQKVLAAAKLLQLQGRNLANTATALNRVASSAPTYWRGADAQRFRADAQRAQSLCTTASRQVSEVAQHAIRNAVAQLATSDEYGGTGGRVSGSNLQLALNTANALWTGVKVSADGSFKLGPDVKVSADGHVLGVPYSGSAHAWAGAQGSGHAEAGANLKDGAYAKANGSFQAGAGADAHGSIGNQWFKVNDDASVLAGVTATGSAGVYAGLFGGGADAKGEAFAGAMAENKTYVGNQFVNGTTDLKALAGAEASGDAGAHADIFGAGVSAHGEAFAGAKATASQEIDVGGFKGSGSISAEAGAGVEGGVDANVGWHDIGGDVDLGAALGGGADVKLGLHFDPAEAVGDAGTVASGAWHAVFGK